MHLSEIVTWPTNEIEANFTNVSLWEPAVHEVCRRERIRYKFFPPGVLVNGDLTDDRIYPVETETGWHISDLIDFADAAIGPPNWTCTASDSGHLRRTLVLCAPSWVPTMTALLRNPA